VSHNNIEKRESLFSRLIFISQKRPYAEFRR